MLLSIVDGGDPDQLLGYLPAIDQEGHKSRMQPPTCDLPKFYWIFRDMDFEQWRLTTASGVKMLWLSGPAECQISGASSCIVDLAKKTYAGVRHSVLYFFCSTTPAGVRAITSFACTIVHQLACCSPQLKEKVVSTFLRTLADNILRMQSRSEPERSLFKADDSMKVLVEKVLEISSREAYWEALRAVADVAREYRLSLIIDGLDKAEKQEYEFIRELDRFIEHLRERHATTRVLLTSRPQAEIKDILGRLPCIEYDRERKGMICHILFSGSPDKKW